MQLGAIILLAVALSLDGLGAGVAYGLKGVKVPLGSLAITGIITVVAVLLSMWIAGAVAAVLPPYLATSLGAALLIALGAWSIVQEWLKQSIPAGVTGTPKQFKLDIGVISLVINIYKKPLEADLDLSGHLDYREAGLLGLALALDALVAGIGLAMSGGVTMWTPVIIGLVQMGFIKLGTVWGRKAADAADLEAKMPYLPGAILMFLGIARLLKP